MYKIIKRILCGHYKWIKTGNKLGCMLDEYKCKRCSKIIYRELFNSPISYREQTILYDITNITL